MHPLVGFEPTISTGERPQTYALDRAASGTGALAALPQEITLVPIKMDAGLAPQAVWAIGENKSSLPLLGFVPRNVHALAGVPALTLYLML